MITLTKAAANQVEKMLKQDPSSPRQLRIFVEAGGCSGFEYGMKFDKPAAGDHELESEGVCIVIDSKSLEQLKGSVIDFDDGLHGKGFEVKNPNAKNTCGCGKSFS